MRYLGYEPEYYDGKNVSRLSILFSYLFGYFLSRTIGKKKRSSILRDRNRIVNKYKVNYRRDVL